MPGANNGVARIVSAQSPFLTLFGAPWLLAPWGTATPAPRYATVCILSIQYPICNQTSGVHKNKCGLDPPNFYDRPEGYVD